MIRSLAAAAAWVDRVGLALLFPKADVVLPSLWDQVAEPGAPVSVRDEQGTFVSWSKGMDFLWSAKDELPGQGLVCVGRHLAGVVALVSPRLLPALVAASGEEGGGAVVDAIRDLGPLTSPQLRDATGLAKKDVDRELATLHRRLVLTSSHWVEGESAWGAIAHDLLDRKWPLGPLPGRDEARRELAALVLAGAGELTAADLAGVFRWRRKESAALLDEVADGRDDPVGFRIWTRR